MCARYFPNIYRRRQIWEHFREKKDILIGRHTTFTWPTKKGQHNNDIIKNMISIKPWKAGLLITNVFSWFHTYHKACERFITMTKQQNDQNAGNTNTKTVGSRSADVFLIQREQWAKNGQFIKATCMTTQWMADYD